MARNSPARSANGWRNRWFGKRAPTVRYPGRLELLRFEGRLLPRRDLAVLGLSTLFFAAGCTRLLRQMWSGAAPIWTTLDVVLVALGIGGLLWKLHEVLSGLLDEPTLNVQPSLDIPRLAQEVQPEAGGEILILDKNRDAAVRSPCLDRYLRTPDGDFEIEVEQDRAARRAVFERLRRDATNRRLLLRAIWSHHVTARKMFSNDDNVCLSSDLWPLPDPRTVRVFKGCYYLSFLTHEAARLDIEENDSHEEPSRIWSAVEEFRAEVINDQKQLLRLSQSRLPNHIGANTLAITNDGEMLLWRQSMRAAFSSRYLAPTGSGSLDWADRVGTSSFREMIIRGMEREYLEESTRQGSRIQRNQIKATKILGHFRWLGRGGLPGFVGITGLHVPADALKPNKSEVVKPEKEPRTQYRAGTIYELKESATHLLKEKEQHLSLPLFVNLLALIQTIEEDPAYLNGIIPVSPSAGG